MMFLWFSIWKSMHIEILPNQSVELELMIGSKPRQFSGLVKSIEGPVVFLQVANLASQEAEQLDGSHVRLWLATAYGLYAIPANCEKISGRSRSVILRAHLFLGRAEKIQRRDYFRLRCREILHYLPEICWDDPELQGWREARTIDLSGNALSFRAAEPLATGTHVHIRLFLAKRQEPIVIGSRVVSAEPMNRPETYKIVAQFVEIDERERWQIIGHLNALQCRKCRYL